jgi:hypothetical protein
MGVRACCGRGVGGVKVVRELLVFEDEGERMIWEELDEAVELKADQEYLTGLRKALKLT